MECLQARCSPPNIRNSQCKEEVIERQGCPTTHITQIVIFIKLCRMNSFNISVIWKIEIGGGVNLPLPRRGDFWLRGERFWRGVVEKRAFSEKVIFLEFCYLINIVFVSESFNFSQLRGGTPRY